MKSLILLLSFICLISSCDEVQDKAPTNSNRDTVSQARPDNKASVSSPDSSSIARDTNDLTLRLDEAWKVLQFGKMRLGTEKEIPVRIMNTCDSTIFLDWAKPSGGGALVRDPDEWSGNRKPLAPGSSMRMIVSFDGSVVGLFRRSVSFRFSGCNADTTYVLNFSGEVME